MENDTHHGADGIPKRFRDLSADVREERLVRYVVKQLGQGRHMDDVMKDEEVVAHSSEVVRSELMQNPDVLKALEEQIKREFSDYTKETAPGVEGSDSEGKVGPAS